MWQKYLRDFDFNMSERRKVEQIDANIYLHVKTTFIFIAEW